MAVPKRKVSSARQNKRRSQRVEAGEAGDCKMPEMR